MTQTEQRIGMQIKKLLDTTEGLFSDRDTSVFKRGQYEDLLGHLVASGYPQINESYKAPPAPSEFSLVSSTGLNGESEIAQEPSSTALVVASPHDMQTALQVFQHAGRTATDNKDSDSGKGQREDEDLVSSLFRRLFIESPYRAEISIGRDLLAIEKLDFMNELRSPLSRNGYGSFKMLCYAGETEKHLIFYRTLFKSKEDQKRNDNESMLQREALYSRMVAGIQKAPIIVGEYKVVFRGDFYSAYHICPVIPKLRDDNIDLEQTVKGLLMLTHSRDMGDRMINCDRDYGNSTKTEAFAAALAPTILPPYQTSIEGQRELHKRFVRAIDEKIRDVRTYAVESAKRAVADAF